MNASSLALTLFSVVLSALAQITFKYGVTQPTVQLALGEASNAPWYRTAATVLFHPAVLTGFALYGFSMVAWLVVLSKVDVSVAYPFVAIGFVITMAAGALFFHEPVGLARICGTALVCVGVALVAGVK